MMLRSVSKTIVVLMAAALVCSMSAPLSADGPASPAAAPRNDKWVVIGPGGGGTMYIPTVSPHDTNRVLTRCDMTGSYISNDAGESWRMFNLRGVSRFFVFDPVEPDTIYARASGLFRSTDGAVTWSLVHPDPEKVSAYECGFNAFDDARMKFDVRFYLVSILFIIFDLEIAFLFPWAVGFKDISDVGFWSMMVFLAVLTIGFAYEWKKGALEWE